MLKPHTIADLSHFDLFRILDFLKANCDPRDKDAPFDAKQYADLYNFAATSRRHRRVLRDWSRDIYDWLEIELLQVQVFKRLTVKFNEIHRTLKGASKARTDWYMDLYTRAMLCNQGLECIELSYDPKNYLSNHEEIFQRIVRAIQANSNNKTKVKELIVNIAECEFSGLGLFRNISKLCLTARFPMFDLVKFCKNNPSLSSLELNTYVFSDQGKLTYIVEHCPKLKELKFVLNDNGWIRDEEYVKLANLDRLQQLEVRKPGKIAWKIDMEIEDEYGSSTKRPRMDAGYEALIKSEEPKEPNVPVRSLLAAISARKRQTLTRLILKFEIDNDLAETIGKIKNLRLLECGLYDPRSIRHFAKLDKLTKLSLLNKGHLISPEVLQFLSRNITVSSFDTQISFSPRGTLGIISNDPNLFRDVDFALLLSLENIKCLFFSSTKMFTTMNYISLLENGIEIKSNEVSVTFDIGSMCLCIYVDMDARVMLPLPIVENLQSYRMVSLAEPRPILLKSLAAHYSKTLQEVYIHTPDTLFELPRNEYLREEDVAAVAQITALRRVSCVLQKLKYIQPLAQLMELESLVVLSEHNPRQVEFARWMLPILERCPKLGYFQISVPPRRLPDKFFMHLEDKLIKSGRGILPKLKICLASKDAYSFTNKELRQIQNMEHSSVQTKFQEKNYLLD